jgi:hypothetical protein
MIAVAVIAAVVSIPVAYYVINLNSQPSSLNVSSFIPSNSTVVMRYNVNGSSYSLSASNGSYGGIIPISSTSLQSGLNSISSGSNLPGTGQMSINYYGSNGGYNIYAISNLSTGNISSQRQNISISNLNPTILLKLLITQNSSLYFSPLSSGEVIIGDLGFINDSIANHNAGRFYKDYNFLPANQNLSFVIALNGRNSVSIHGMVNYTHTSISIQSGLNLSDTMMKYVANTLNETGLNSEITVTDNTILFSINIGLRQYGELLKMVLVLSETSRSISVV